MRHNARMRDQIRYKMRDSILTPRSREKSVWIVTFTPVHRPQGPPFDPEWEKEIVIPVSPEKINGIRTDHEYTVAQIDALRAQKGLEGDDAG